MRISSSSAPSESSRDSKEISGTDVTATRRLKLLSYNIQAGIATNGYRHYLTHSWKHLLPCPKRLDNLSRIASLIGGFDIVGLQEVDAGSLRSGFINQTEFLAIEGRFPYWYDQTNRNLGKFAQHGTVESLMPCGSDASETPRHDPRPRCAHGAFRSRRGCIDSGDRASGIGPACAFPSARMHRRDYRRLPSRDRDG